MSEDKTKEILNKIPDVLLGRALVLREAIQLTELIMVLQEGQGSFEWRLGYKIKHSEGNLTNLIEERVLRVLDSPEMERVELLGLRHDKSRRRERGMEGVVGGEDETTCFKALCGLLWEHQAARFIEKAETDELNPLHAIHSCFSEKVTPTLDAVYMKKEESLTCRVAYAIRPQVMDRRQLPPRLWMSKIRDDKDWTPPVEVPVDSRTESIFTALEGVFLCALISICDSFISREA